MNEKGENNFIKDRTILGLSRLSSVPWTLVFFIRLKSKA